MLDRHLRFAIAAQAIDEGEGKMKRYLSLVKEEMGGASSFYFSQFNPNGRYMLNLKNPHERDIVKNLVLRNKEVHAKIMAKELCDRSQMGNKSCFRNERVNGRKFEMSNGWNMPDTGKFEFDFVAFDDVPTKDQESSEQEIIALKQWFLNTIE
jgi:hypothetical protein